MATSSTKRINFLNIGKSIGLAMLPLALFFMPLDWFAQQPSLCVFKAITGHECYGCGITKAVMHLMHGDFLAAWHYNKLIVIVFPVLLYLWIKYLIKWWRVWPFARKNANH